MSPTHAVQPSIQDESYNVASHTAVTDPGVPQAEKERLAQETLRKVEYIRDKWNQGELPPNAEIDAWLASMETTDKRNKLSSDGLVVLEDWQEMIKLLRRFLAEKNQGEVLQQYLLSTKRAGQTAWNTHGDKVKDASSGAVGNIKSALRKDQPTENEVGQGGMVAYNKALPVAKLLIASPRFRSLLTEMSALPQYFLANLGERAAGKVREKADQRQTEADRLHEEAENNNGLRRDDNYHPGHDNKNSGMRRDDSAYQSSSQLPAGFDQSNGSLGLDNYTGTQNTLSPGMANYEIAREQQTTYGSAHPAGGMSYNSTAPRRDGRDDAEDLAEAGKSQAQDAKAKFNEKTDLTTGLENTNANTGDKADAKADKAISKFDGKTQDRLASGKSALKSTWKEEVPQERRDALEDKVRALIRDLVREPEYQDAIQYFLQSLSDMASSTVQTGQKVDAQGADLDPTLDRHMTDANNNLRLFVERLANGNSLQPLLNAISAMKTCVLNDDELHGRVKEYMAFIEKSLREEGFIDREEWRDEHSERKERVSQLVDERYGPQRDDLGYHIGEMFRHIRLDPLNAQINATGMRLFEDIAKDDEGNFTVKQELLQDMTGVLIPSLAQHIRFVPLPTIDIDDEKYHARLSNVILTTRNVLPNMVEMSLWNAVVLGLQNNTTTRAGHHLKAAVYQVHCDINNAQFEVFRKKKNGVSKLFDQGLMDLFIGGQGVSVQLEVDLNPVEEDRAIKARVVRASIDTLKVKVHKAKYSLLYKIGLLFAKSTIKKQVEANIEKQIYAQIDKLNDQLIKSKRAAKRQVKNKGSKLWTMGKQQANKKAAQDPNPDVRKAANAASQLSQSADSRMAANTA